MSALKFLLAPGSLALLSIALIAGFVARRQGGRVARVARVWVLLWLTAYTALSLPIVTRTLVWGLGVAAPITGGNDPRLRARAIVLLSGSAGTYRLADERVTVLEAPSALRVHEAARVQRLLDSPLVVVSGAGERGERSPEVLAIQASLIAAGVPADRVVIEGASRDTHQSAGEVQSLLRVRGIPGVILVTSAQHVGRAMRVYRRAGIDAIASPAPLLPPRYRRGWRAFVPDAQALHFSALAMHEYGGLLYYWLRGWG